MANLNKVMIMGNLTRDPELRYLPSNTPVVGFGVAVNRRWTDRQTNEKREETTFVDVSAFGRTAEVINQYFRKGRPIFVEGRLRFEQWKDQQGNNRNRLTVVCEQFEFIGGREDAPGGGVPGPGNGGSGGGGGGYGGGSGGGGNFGGGSGAAPRQNQAPPPADDGPPPMPEEDIPF